MTTIIDAHGDQLSFAQLFDEGLGSFDLDDMFSGSDPAADLEALEDEAFEEWEKLRTYRFDVPPFREFLKTYIP